jgi:antitoxin FitA
VKPLGSCSGFAPWVQAETSPYAINAITSIIAVIDIINSSAIIDVMASITIRQLPETTKRKLRIRAAQNGRSMEQEAREILTSALKQAVDQPKDLGKAIRKLFAPYGGVELKIPPREPIPEDRIKKIFGDDRS